MIIDADTLDAEHAYKLLIATIVPRAIGWLSTLSVEGVPSARRSRWNARSTASSP